MIRLPVNSLWKSFRLMSFLILLTNLCYADNPVGIINDDVVFRTVLQKPVQEINYNQMTYIRQTFTDGEWENMSQTIAMYDDLGKIIEEISHSWKDNEWVNTAKHNYSYDESEQLTEKLRKVWRDEEWIESLKINYIYDDKGYLAEELRQNFSSDEWTASSKSRYIYDEKMNMIHEYRDRLIDDTWEPSLEVIYTYDDQGRLIEELSGHFRTSGTNVTKRNYTYYDRDLLIERAQSSWNNDLEEWKQYRRNTFTYNDQGDEVEELEKWWFEESWKTSMEFTTSYDEHGRISEFLQFTYDYLGYDGGKGKLSEEFRNLFTYDSITHIAENTERTPAALPLTANYPNPFNLSTTINFSLPEAGHAELVIFNVTGQKIRNLLSEEMTPGEHSIVWDGCDDSGVPVTTGVYFSRLRTFDSTVSGRMMLVK